jgi:release factor glutamine methyltransferase
MTPNLNDAYFHLAAELKTIYDDRESAAIAHEVMEAITGKTKLQRMSDKDCRLTEAQHVRYSEMKELLLDGMPLQYVLGNVWFLGKVFHVDSRVLIPRPETEELVTVAVAAMKKTGATNPKILDIGTGSGCIAISMQLLLPNAEVWSCDISQNALAVARQNAQRLNARVNFIELDFLNRDAVAQLPIFDCIISNPPYIPNSEKERMHINVTKFEPELALFVPDTAPLVFYDAIADFGTAHLSSSGIIFCETEASLGAACKILFSEKGYRRVLLEKDINGNDRILSASLH